MTNDKDVKILLTRLETELVNLGRTVHEAVEKSRKRIYELKLEFTKKEMAEPIQIVEPTDQKMEDFKY